jgi:hypothetical protein
MIGMARFALKDLLRGITLVALGFGMLAVVLHGNPQPTSAGLRLWQQMLVGFGGMLIGYGIAFPISYPPHQMILAMTGVFAAQAWFAGTTVGLMVYLGLTATIAAAQYAGKKRLERKE